MRDSTKGAGPANPRPISDHFDGRRFFNPTLPGGSAPTFRKRIQDVAGAPDPVGLASVENKGVPQLNA